MSQDRALGQHLVNQGWIRTDQLAKALSSQAVLGGRVGTCLLEMEALTEDLLLKGLSAQTGAPGVGAEDLRQIPDDVIELLSPRVAVRLKVVPFRLALGKLDVAMLDVFDLSAQDEIAFVTGKRITAHICLEVRLREALDRFYKFECPSRYAHLLDRLNRSRYLWSTEGPAPKTDTDQGGSSRPPGTTLSGVFALPPQELPRMKAPSTKPIARPAIPSAAPTVQSAGPQPEAKPARGRSRPSTISLTASERAELLGPPPAKMPISRTAPTRALPPQPLKPPPPPAPAPTRIPSPTRIPVPATKTTFDQFNEQLTQLTSRDEVAQALLVFLSDFFDRAGLFMVRMGEVHGWIGSGPGYSQARLERFQADFSQPSVFLNLKTGSPFYLGPLAPMAVHKKLIECWDGRSPRECLVLPLKIKERLVTIVYGDNLERSLAGIDIQAMQRLATKVAGAFELCILRNKLKST